MNVYYALYDQSYDNNAQYWTWFPGEITQQMRDAIASKSGAFQMRPKRPNLLSDSDIVGGIINYQDQWCVVYRFFNGGNDPQGRPDRCVLATAWVRTVEAQGQNLYALLFCPVFLDVQRQALYQCPVQVPKALVENCNYPVSQNDPQFVIYNNNPNIGSWSFRNPNEVEVIGKLFPILVRDGLKSLEVLQSAAYMETFSGAPLASGITYVPKVVVQPEQPVYVGGYDFPDQQPQRRNTYLVFLLAMLFIVTSVVAFDYLTNHSFISFVLYETGIVKKQTPRGQNPEGQNPEGQNSEGQNPEGQNPEGQNPEGQNPEEQSPEEQSPEEQSPEGQNPEGQHPEGQNPEGQSPEGQSPTEQNPMEQNPMGQNPTGQNPMEQNPMEQNPMEQNPTGQNPTGQNPTGQNPTGQNPTGQNPMGQNPTEQNPTGQNPTEQNPTGQNPTGQNPNGQESGRPIYPSEQIRPSNPPTDPGNVMSGEPLIKM